MAALAGVWLANGIALLVASRYIITQVRELLQQVPCDIAVGASRDHRRRFFSPPRMNCPTNGSGW
jgi:hypothetical protein